MNLRTHVEYGAPVRAPIDEVFAYLDDHGRLSAHMGRSSWMMGGGYAKWCTRSMLDDAVAHFAPLPSGPGLHHTHRGAAQ